MSPKRSSCSSIPTSLADLTIGKVIAYILVAYAIAVLVRIAWKGITDEPFYTTPELQTDSSSIALCQHNTTQPCHRRELRGEDTQCDYAWNAPAVFKDDVRIHGTNTQDAMRKMRFCTKVQTNDPRDIRADCNDKDSLESVWDAFTSGLNKSKNSLLKRVGLVEKKVRENTDHVSRSQKAMKKARQAMNLSAQQASTSNTTLSSIDSSLQAHDVCDRKLMKAQTDLTTTQKTLQTTKASLTAAKSSLTVANSHIDSLQQELVDAQGQSQQMNTTANTDSSAQSVSTSTPNTQSTSP